MNCQSKWPCLKNELPMLHHHYKYLSITYLQYNLIHIMQDNYQNFRLWQRYSGRKTFICDKDFFYENFYLWQRYSFKKTLIPDRDLHLWKHVWDRDICLWKLLFVKDIHLQNFYMWQRYSCTKTFICDRDILVRKLLYVTEIFL